MTQLIIESVEASIHALKLCGDVIECHAAHRRGGIGYGWSRRNGRSCQTGPPQTKLRLASFNGSGVIDTHHVKVVRSRKENIKMAYDPCDSGRKDKLIMGRRILINIYDGKNEM